MFMRNQNAVEVMLDALNEQLAARHVRFVPEHGGAQTTITALDIRLRRGVGGRCRSQQTTRKSVLMPTDIYLVFGDEGEGGSPASQDATPPVGLAVATAAAMDAGPPGGGPSAGSKIKELKELLDCGAITQEEFNTNKAKLLEMMTST